MKNKNKEKKVNIMANTLNQDTVRDVSISILVRDLTGRMYPLIADTTQYDNIYEWVRFKIEEAGINAPTQQEADSDTYLYDNALILIKAEIAAAMNTF